MLYDRYSHPIKPQAVKPFVPEPLKAVVQRRIDNRGVVEEYWPGTSGGGHSYSVTFGPLIAQHFRLSSLDSLHLSPDLQKKLELELMYLESRILPNIIDEETERKGRELRVLDLMSQGAFHRDLRLRGTVVGLVDTRSLQQKDCHQNNRTEYLEGDIHDSRLWGCLRDTTRRNGGFDMVIARPRGGIFDVTATKPFYGLLLTRMYRLLDPDNGLLLTEYDPQMHGVVEEQVARLNAIKEVSAFHNLRSSTFMLVRGEGAPDARSFKDLVLNGSAR